MITVDFILGIVLGAMFGAFCIIYIIREYLKKHWLNCCLDDGIGRHDRLKICWTFKVRVGSSPIQGTKEYN